jgi:hypothetical protein
MIIEPTTDSVADATLASTLTPPRRPSRARRRVAAIIRTLVVTISVLGIVTLVWPGLFGAWSVRADGAVPRSIDLPWRWQASAEVAPPGPAALVATGEPATPQPGALPTAADPAASDIADPVEVIGRNGVYRSLYPDTGQWHAGEEMRLSPDGGRLALPYLHDQTTAQRGPTIVDLTTGRTSVISAAGLPAHDSLAVIGWRPDGGALLLAAIAGPSASVMLLDLGTAVATPLTVLPVPQGPVGWRFAFSPDGRRVVYATDGWLHVVDDHGATVWTTPLPAGYLVAGEGAFTPDGERIALVHAVLCPQACPDTSQWSVTYVDSSDGSPTDGTTLPTIEAAQVRAVGWRTDGDTETLVVVRYLPHPPPQVVQKPDGTLVYPSAPTTGDEAQQTGPADLYELSAGQQPRLLLTAPYEVTDLDVAADLVREGRFAGNPSTPSLLPIQPGRVRLVDVALAAAVLGGLAAVVAVAVSLTERLTLRLIARWRRRRPVA